MNTRLAKHPIFLGSFPHHQHPSFWVIPRFLCVSNREKTPLKINMEHSHGGLEDHFPF